MNYSLVEIRDCAIKSKTDKQQMDMQIDTCFKEAM